MTSSSSIEASNQQLHLPQKIDQQFHLPQKIDMSTLSCFYSQPQAETGTSMEEVPWPRFEDLIAATLLGHQTQNIEATVKRDTSPSSSKTSKPASLETSDVPDPRRKLFVKTQLCRFYAKGWCRSGPACAFAHTSEEVRACPDLTKTSICHRWARHQCPRSAKDCRYAHGTWDLQK